MGRAGCSPPTLPKRCSPSLTRPPWTRPTLRRSRTALAPPVSPRASICSGCEYHVRLGYITHGFLWCALKGKGSPGSESDGGDSRSDLGSGEIQPKKVMTHSTLPTFTASWDFPSSHACAAPARHVGISSKALFLTSFLSVLMSEKL